MASEYERAGVSIDAQDEAIARIKRLVRPTFTPGVVGDLGRFGGLFALEPGRYQDPLLVSSTDGVGTKLKLAFLTGIHDTVGYDLVSHCTSDILTQGARPLFFLDYIAMHRLVPDVVEAIVAGMARACTEAGCALIGGELAEMGSLYREGEYDMAGFIVGVVDRSRYLDGRDVRPGDVLLGLGSTGLHTNGYSLARRILLEKMGLGPGAHLPELGMTVAEALLQPHRLYLNALLPALDDGRIKALAHITGGGLTDNVPRALPPNCDARIDRASFPMPPLFALLGREGNLEADEMYRVFNMGIGMVAIVDPTHADGLARGWRVAGEAVHAIGEITTGSGRVIYG